MSNPILRPGDPRFQKPSLHDASGQNLFGDGAAGGIVPASLADGAGEPAQNGEGGDIFASPTVGPGFTYRPQFVTMQKDRGTLLLILSMIGLAGAAAGAMSLGSLFVWGWFIPFLTLAASVTAWFLGAQDLRAMHLGAMKSEGRTTTLLATWLGGFGTLLVVGFVALMVWLGISFLPSFLG